MPSPHSLARCTALAFTLLCSTAFGQHENRWFKVELMVLVHQGAAGNEQFEPTPALGYPEDYRFLLYPDSLRSIAAGHDGEAWIDDIGRLNLLPPRVEPDTPDIPQQSAASTLETKPASPAVVEPESGEETVDEPLLPTPFIALPAAQREFRGKAAYMERTGEYRILFHEAWAQPVPGEAQALPLVLDRSGDSQSWPELQGTIKLHVSRYLHLETRLWLNTSGEYLPGNWRMPDAPLGPPSVVVIEPPPVAEDTPLAEPAVEVYEAGSLLEAEAEQAAPLAEEDLGPVSPWRHAVLLEQRRRMRSLEVHYIDHPLLSVVIKVEPLDEEQLEAMARAETPILPGIAAPALSGAKQSP